MKIIAIVQARTGSTRFPNKIFCDLVGFPLLHHVIERLRPSKKITEVVVATTKNVSDDSIMNWCDTNNVKCFRGSEENVLERYYKTAEYFDADIVVRVTADDPFKDYRLIDKAIKVLQSKKMDFVCNNNPTSFPEGLDVEVLTFESLKKSYESSVSKFEQEHVTQFIHRNKNEFRIHNIENDLDLSHYRWTLDTNEDYQFVLEIYNRLYEKNKNFLTEDIYQILREEPELIKINKMVQKSQMYK